MKNVFALILSLMVLCTTLTPAFASEINVSDAREDSGEYIIDEDDNVPIEHPGLYEYVLKVLAEPKEKKVIEETIFKLKNVEVPADVLTLYKLNSPESISEIQKWFNDTYSSYHYFTPINIDGKFSTEFLNAFVFGIQIELNRMLILSPGTDLNIIFNQLNNDVIASNKNLTRIFQYALRLKGYKIADESLGTFDTNTENAIIDLKRDCGYLDCSDPSLDTKWINAIISTNIYVPSADKMCTTLRVIQQALNKIYSDYFGIISTNGLYDDATHIIFTFALETKDESLQNNDSLLPTQHGQRLDELSKRINVRLLKRLCKIIDSVDTKSENQINTLFKPIFSGIFGFKYDPIKDIYYTKENAPQKHFGFGDLFDEFGPLLGMDIEEAPIVFQYTDPKTNDTKEWLIELWKGQYGGGLSVGGEIGLYNRPVTKDMDPYIPGKGNYHIFFDSAVKNEKMHLAYTLYDKDNSVILKRDSYDYPKPIGEPQGKDWWLLGIKFGRYAEKEDLTMKAKIKLLSRSMAKIFVKTIQQHFSDQIFDIVRDGRKVTLIWKTCHLKKS